MLFLWNLFQNRLKFMEVMMTDDNMSVAGCDEVNDSDIDFIDDIIQGQDTLNYIGWWISPGTCRRLF